MNSTGGIQIRLGDLIYGVLKRWRLILVLTFIGLVFGVLISAFSYLQGSYSNYQIDASFVILTKAKPDLFTAYGTDYPHPADYDFAADLVDTVDFVIESDLTMNQAIDSLKIIGIKPQDISQNLTLTPMGSTAVVEVTFTWRNAEEGIAILNAVLEASQKTLHDTLQVGELSIIDAPAARQSITGTLGGSVWGYMTILGFLAGVGYVLLELIMRPTLTNLNDMEGVLGLESLGVIPKDKKYFKNKQSLLVDDNITSPAVVENYASTAFILRNRLKAADAPHCFYVTSTIAGEGRSTMAANLAIQLSDMECKVLLIDMDNRNPTLGKLFLSHVDYDRSLNALYKGDATVAESIYTLTGYLDLLPMVVDRQPIPMEGTVFDLIKNLEKDYDYVIIDTSPVGHYSDVLSLNAIADTVLFVVGYDSATLPEIQAALEKLDKSGIRILGGVVNGAQNFSGAARNEDDERMMQLRKAKKKEVLIWEKQEGEEPVDLSETHRGPWTKNRKKKNKSKTRRHRQHKHDKKYKKKTSITLPSEQPKPDKPANVVRERRKDILEELMETSQDKHYDRISDDDARNALFKIGVEGDFDQADTDGDENAEGKAAETKDSADMETVADMSTEMEPGVVTDPEVIADPDILADMDSIADMSAMTESDVVTDPDVVTKLNVVTEPDVVTDSDAVTNPDAVTVTEENADPVNEKETDDQT